VAFCAHDFSAPGFPEALCSCLMSFQLILLFSFLPGAQFDLPRSMVVLEIPIYHVYMCHLQLTNHSQEGPISCEILSSGRKPLTGGEGTARMNGLGSAQRIGNSAEKV
jgi:hypothetical protein